MCRYPTVSLLFRRREVSGTDRYGDDSATFSSAVEVPGCLFAPMTAQQLGTGHPEGALVSARAHFPAGTDGLRGALVGTSSGDWYRVVGEPVPYPDGCVRGLPWDVWADLERADG